MTRSERKQLEKLQDLVSQASAFHGNDRDRDGFEKGQRCLAEAFDLILAMRSKYPPEDV